MIRTTEQEVKVKEVDERAGSQKVSGVAFNESTTIHTNTINGKTIHANTINGKTIHIIQAIH